ncbi:MAG: MATE family efflux transporter, partial [Lachnospiraceae bacterium]|nr:MATE family efflux transporter [Lachnospiraceae bacterium]
RTGTRQGTAMTVLTALVLVPLIILCGPYLMDLFAPGNTELINLAMGMMYILAVGYIAMGVTQSLQGVIRGAGDTMSPMWITIATTVLIRIPLAYGLVAIMRSLGAPRLTQEKMIFVSLLTVWIVGALITVIVYFRGSWRKKIPNYKD